MPWVPVSSVNRGCAANAGATRAMPTTAAGDANLELVRSLDQAIGQRGRELERLVFADPVLDRERREEPAVDPARNVVPCRNRQEGPRVVVEAHGIRKSRGLGRLLAKAQHS